MKALDYVERNHSGEGSRSIRKSEHVATGERDGTGSLGGQAEHSSREVQPEGMHAALSHVVRHLPRTAPQIKYTSTARDLLHGAVKNRPVER
jgi:hypothetical protein